VQIFQNYYTISLFLGGLIALLSALMVYFSDRSQAENISWIFANIGSAIWSFGYFAMITTESEQSALLANWIMHAAAIFIPLFYFLFVLHLTKQYEKFKWILLPGSILAIFFTVINTTSYFIRGVLPKYIFNYAPDAGSLYIYFAIYFFALVIGALLVVLRGIIHSDGIEKLRLKYIFYTGLLGFLGGGGVFFLTFNVNIPPYPIILYSIYPLLITYAMFKHKVFDTKVVSTELLMFALWIALLFRFLLAETLQDRLFNLVLLLAVFITGIFLIRSVVREVNAREKIEKLAKDLEKANDRLRELDKQKSEFLSFATHQLRSPLTAIKGYSSLMLEGDFGPLPEAIKEPVDRIFQSTEGMVLMVDDFLNISRIEQGRMKYEMTETDISKLAEEIAGEMKPVAEKKNLVLSFKSDSEHLSAPADPGKLRQVIANLIDNSIKYTPQGNVDVAVAKSGNNIRISISDTGVGISKKEISNLFEKFSRAKNANKVNVSGTGLGLYLAKKIVEAHKGKIWAESAGEGKGSQFIVEIPVK